MLLIRKPKSTLFWGGNKYEQTCSHHSRTLPETELDPEDGLVKVEWKSKVRKETGPNPPCISSQQPLADGQLPPGSASRSGKGISCWRAPPKPLPSRPGQGTGCAGLPFPRRVKTPTQHKSHIKAASTCQNKKDRTKLDTDTNQGETHTL